MKQPSSTLRIANAFGALGYLSCLMQWLWMLVIVIFPLFDSEAVRSFFVPSGSLDTNHTQPVALPPILQTILVAVALIFSVAIIVYAAISIPRAVGKVGKKMTHHAAEVVTHTIEQSRHAPLPRKRKKMMIIRMTWAAKLLLIVVPLGLLMVPSPEINNLSSSVVLAFGVFCAAFTIIWFSIQLSIAKIARLDPQHVW